MARLSHGRSERPATGMGSPEPDARASITCEPYESGLSGLSPVQGLQPMAASAATIASSPSTATIVSASRARLPSAG